MSAERKEKLEQKVEQVGKPHVLLPESSVLYRTLLFSSLIHVPTTQSFDGFQFKAFVGKFGRRTKRFCTFIIAQF